MKAYWRIGSAMLAIGVVASVVTIGDACFMRSPMPVQVWLDHVTVDITDQVAVKTYNCTFKNPNPRAVVGGTCYMELEPGAQVDNMSVLVDGKEMRAEILDVEKAKKVFNDIVKKGGSPALLEYYGNQLIQTHVPRISPGGTVTVKLTYTTLLKKRGGLIRLQLLNTNPKALMQPLKNASVTVNIKSKQPIKNIYSPTHEIDIGEKPGWDVSVNWKKENYLAKHPFVLYYQIDEDHVAASVVAHREVDEDGTFMMMLSPTIGKGKGQITKDQILPKDVVFCVDTSGSMLDENKMNQAREALAYCVKNLRKGDRFNIVNFSTTAKQFHETGLVEFTKKSETAALEYIEILHARGGTAISDALELSLKHLGNKAESNGRLKMMIFATDGIPTIGERNPQSILKMMKKKNTQDVRIFVFGEGFKVNTRLLDFLALHHRGEADYILPKENITEKISQFFDRVGSPIMTDLEIDFEGLQVKDVYPRKVNDVFKGEQVIIYGRYTGHGSKKIKLTGTVAGKKQTFEYTLDFPEYSEDDMSSFVPRLWAGRKVDFLLNEIRTAEKPSKELVNEVTYLAKRYGIVTPYTSYLISDDIATIPPPGTIPGPGGPRPMFFRKGAQKQELLKNFQRDVARNKVGQGGFGGGERVNAVNDAKKLAELRTKNRRSGAASSLEMEVDGYLSKLKNGKKKSSLQAVRYLGSKTFYNYANQWYDSQYDPEKDKNLIEIEVGSDEYFKLLQNDTRVAKYLALGKLIVKVKGKWYRITAKKTTKKK